jgi:hypothetical protein
MAVHGVSGSESIFGFANRLFESIENLRKALRPDLQRFWDDAQAVLSLIGRPWLQSQANATTKN